MSFRSELAPLLRANGVFTTLEVLEIWTFAFKAAPTPSESFLQAPNRLRVIIHLDDKRKKAIYVTVLDEQRLDSQSLKGIWLALLESNTRSCAPYASAALLVVLYALLVAKICKTMSRCSFRMKSCTLSISTAQCSKQEAERNGPGESDMIVTSSG